ncbi:uncharacterized protein LOC6569442 [Drosophila grimshawi]|uniref:GH17772 n=1 Tax=Drosophila grimshawi TaxID=7222 RepID=B4JXN1_DROGR|nr:uncharacterized protein LOC6569442 [Drosophila grimshawi]EDV95130.1 GH17772 [Drosophila grimshawi]
MLRQYQLRVPIRDLKLKRFLTFNAKQMLAYIEPVKKEPLPKMQSEAVQLVPEPDWMNRYNNNLKLGHYDDMDMEQATSVALVPFDHSTIEQNLKNVSTLEPQPHPQPQEQPQPQAQMPKQPLRKTNYNPLRRRSNVDPARVQYIKDRFKDVNMETVTNNNKTLKKKFVSRTTLHSGRLDKIN